VSVAAAAGALLRLAGAEVTLAGTNVTLRNASLPAAAPEPAPPPCEGRSAVAVLLPCAPTLRLRVGGLAVQRGRAIALLVAGGQSVAVREGDFIGHEERALADGRSGAHSASWRVHAIAPEGVVLTQEAPGEPFFVRRLRLGDPEPDAASLGAF
jgi:hypothetical protein